MKFDFVDKYAMATLSVQEDGPLALQWKKKKKSLGGHDLWIMEGVGAAIVAQVVLSIAPMLSMCLATMLWGVFIYFLLLWLVPLVHGYFK